MKLSAFDYDLPPEAIAQAPLPERDASRMMVLHRNDTRIEHAAFCDITSFLHAGDVLVVNDSKVIPARLTGTKETGGTVEILLLSGKDNPDDHAEAVWDVLLKPAKRVREGTVISFGQKGRARVTKRLSDKKWRLVFSTAGTFDDFLQTCGTAPLPPYIKRTGQVPGAINDLERYQNIYAHSPGSVAAPTAGFHFSPRVMEQLVRKGVLVVPVTLHVGYGTFVSIETEDVEDHRMEEEWFELTPETARKINEANRVVAVGTTATRVLESTADDAGIVQPHTGTTDLFIYPGYRFKRVNGLLTNFHLPKSSLFLLASAFAGPELIRQAYHLAIDHGYRFYSYGDCSLIL